MCYQLRLRPAWACTQSDQSLCLALKYSVSVELLTEHNLEFLSLKGGCTGSYGSINTLTKYHIFGTRMLRLNYDNQRPTYGNTRKKYRAQIFTKQQEPQLDDCQTRKDTYKDILKQEPTTKTSYKTHQNHQLRTGSSC